jgi:2-polyprenyl-6-methoxyphenol hydroxylase-like FAD-dependent oxidoreductase
MTKTGLIAGAGPVGLTMATELSRYGIALGIVEDRRLSDRSSLSNHK